MNVSKEEWCRKGHDRHSGRVWSEYATGRTSKEEPRAIYVLPAKEKQLSVRTLKHRRCSATDKENDPLECHKPSLLKQGRHPTKRPQE